MLEFCPMCKKLLSLGEWRGKKVGRCVCGFIRTSGINLEGEERLEDKTRGSEVSENKNPEAEGVDFLCRKCGFNKADVKELGEILNNEKSVTFFICLKCGNVERR